MRATIIGTGLIGGSIGLALAEAGHVVVGYDRDRERLSRAQEIGAVSEAACSVAEAARGADIAFVALPVPAIADAVIELLDAGVPLVTDAGSVQGPIVAEVAARAGSRAAHFVGGHPMAGSEQVGIEGAAADLFVGATWVLTPTAATDPTAYARLRAVLADIGADVVALDPDRHDSLVAVVSHVPHLTAATLMTLAADREDEHAAVLKLAAGGFRDMTRIAAGQPSIWPGICDDNAEAIVETLDRLIESLAGMRRRVAERDHRALLEVLGRSAGPAR